MELTQEQVNQIVDIADEYQIELEAAAKRFRRRLGEVGLAIGPAGRLVERERYYRPDPDLRGGVSSQLTTVEPASVHASKVPRITFVDEDRCCGLDVLDDTDEERGH